MKISILLGHLPGMCHVAKWQFLAWVTIYPWNHCFGSLELTIWPAEPSSKVTCLWEGKHSDRFPFPEISIRISIHNPRFIPSKSLCTFKIGLVLRLVFSNSIKDLFQSHSKDSLKRHFEDSSRKCLNFFKKNFQNIAVKISSSDASL